jgi:two-component system, LytTR family, response regulator LytT
MTRLRALVLEDEWPARNYLVQLIEDTRLAEVVGAVSCVGEAREALAGLPVDVVFVDVQLCGGENGLDLIESTIASHAEGARPAFVLATAFSQHAKKACELGVVDYLLKPFSEERVEQCLRRLLSRGASPRSEALRVVARRKRNLVFLDPADIWAFEASDRLSYVHSRLGKFEVDLSLASIESSFGRSLMRVHRNWLVNLEFAKVLEREDGETTLFVGPSLGDESQGVRIPVSRDRAPALRMALLANATGLGHT